MQLAPSNQMNVQAPWFFQVTRQQAINILIDSNKNCCLVRPSSDGLSFALSRISLKDRCVEHLKIGIHISSFYDKN
jgi:hypothetical protein